MKICVVGLGYVGLPLAVEFAKKFPVVGFDINASRIEELNKGFDHTLEVEKTDLKSVISPNLDDLIACGKGLIFTNQKELIKDSEVYIITVPTPIDKSKNPDLSPLLKASESVASVLAKGNYVIYESTVFPGATEEVCVPILEKLSGLKMNIDFHVGYSPERINPGDKERTLTKIKKITSGSSIEAASYIDDLYKTIISAGTYKAASIKVAEAAKVIENSQRDLNIAFVNELSKIFSRLGIDTHEVLEAASTKWNFLQFTPGLVGGHCIGVDPYYLAHKSQIVGYHPEMILAGRRLNDSMGSYFAGEVIKLMIKNSININYSSVLVLGFTFKENCPDIRNTKVIDLINELKNYNLNVDVYDTWANANEVRDEYGLTLKDSIEEKRYEAIILAVAHEKFIDMNFSSILKSNGIIYDLKGVLAKKNNRLYRI